jgi:putative phosphoesterase
MSSYAIISDVHGNLCALESIWNELERRKLTNRTVFNAGDTVAYGKESADCIEFIRASSVIVSVGGNYDYNVARFPDEQTTFERKWNLKRPEKFSSLRDASEQISEHQRTWLSELPELLEFTIEYKSISLSHYSPIGRKIGIGAWTPDDVLQSIADSCSYDVIITGHTHSPFVRQITETVFINPGTVGRSWGRPSFAILTISDGIVSSEVITCNEPQ